MFLQCPFSYNLLALISSWVGIILQPSLQVMPFFVDFAEAVKGKVALRHCLLIWHSIMWCIWEMKNAIIFGDGKVDMVYIPDRIKVCYWRWFTLKLRVFCLAFLISAQILKNVQNESFCPCCLYFVALLYTGSECPLHSY